MTADQDVEKAPAPPVAVESTTTTTTDAPVAPLSRDFDAERYDRARMHFTSLGSVRNSDAFRQYKRSWLAAFFGANEPEPVVGLGGARVHPCKLFSREVHRCLEKNNNDFFLCQTRLANFQQCLKEFDM